MIQDTGRAQDVSRLISDLAPRVATSVVQSVQSVLDESDKANNADLVAEFDKVKGGFVFFFY